MGMAALRVRCEQAVAAALRGVAGTVGVCQEMWGGGRASRVPARPVRGWDPGAARNARRCALEVATARGPGSAAWPRSIVRVGERLGARTEGPVEGAGVAWSGRAPRRTSSSPKASAVKTAGNAGLPPCGVTVPSQARTGRRARAEARRTMPQ